MECGRCGFLRAAPPGSVSSIDQPGGHLEDLVVPRSGLKSIVCDCVAGRQPGASCCLTHPCISRR